MAEPTTAHGVHRYADDHLAVLAETAERLHDAAYWWVISRPSWRMLTLDQQAPWLAMARVALRRVERMSRG